MITTGGPLGDFAAILRNALLRWLCGRIGFARRHVYQGGGVSWRGQSVVNKWEMNYAEQL